MENRRYWGEIDTYRDGEVVPLLFTKEEQEFIHQYMSWKNLENWEDAILDAIQFSGATGPR